MMEIGSVILKMAAAMILLAIVTTVHKWFTENRERINFLPERKKTE